MKLIDILKKLGINIDDEIELTEKKEEKTDSETSKEKDIVINSEKKSEEVKTEEKAKETEEKIEEQKEESEVELVYDEKTGLFDTKGIKDESVLAVLTKANNYTINTANKVKIDKAFDEKMSGLKIRKGITPEAVRSLVKMDGIKVEEGKVVGIDEAFETLQKEQSGLFVQRNQPESNPMLEGFNPVQNTNDNGSALNASLAALSASLGGSN
jgi:hypothetical protein